uniref:Uncharacterized protein n=1 Tax=Anguilla anguilla TaxID=7936 RepID=A0A0E9R3L9_ANGAN
MKDLQQRSWTLELNLQKKTKTKKAATRISPH